MSDSLTITGKVFHDTTKAGDPITRFDAVHSNGMKARCSVFQQHFRCVTGDVLVGDIKIGEYNGKPQFSMDAPTVAAGGAPAPQGAPTPNPYAPKPAAATYGAPAAPSGGMGEGEFLAHADRVFDHTLGEATASVCRAFGVNHAGELSDGDRREIISGAFGTKHTYAIGIQRGDIRPEAPQPQAQAPAPPQQDVPPPTDGDDPFGIPF